MGSKTVYDFDEVVETPLEFKLLGKIRQILPISLEKYASYVNKFALFNAGIENSGKTTDDIANEWFKYLSEFITPLEREEISKMSVAQIAMCFSAIVRRVQGESMQSISDITESTEEKKKNLKSTRFL